MKCLIPILCCAAACQPTVEGLMAKRGAEARRVMAELEEIGRLSKKPPPLQTDRIDWPAADLSLTYPQRNGLLLHLEDFQDLTTRLRIPVRANRRSPTVDVSHLLGDAGKGRAKLPPDSDYQVVGPEPEIVEKLFSQFVATRYVFVVRTVEHRPARMVDSDKYEAGSYRGELLVFQLDGRRQIGGSRFVAKSD